MIAGCFFHLVKNFKKQLGLAGLAVRYRDNPEFSILARMIMSLVFVPEDRVWACFVELQANLPVELTPILNWFKINYIGMF